MSRKTVLLFPSQGAYLPGALRTAEQRATSSGAHFCRSGCRGWS